MYPGHQSRPDTRSRSNHVLPPASNKGAHQQLQSRHHEVSMMSQQQQAMMNNVHVHSFSNSSHSTAPYDTNNGGFSSCTSIWCVCMSVVHFNVSVVFSCAVSQFIFISCWL